MQEQLPLRPAEFVKIRDGFIAFLKQPAGTPLEAVIPQPIIDAMTIAARRGAKQRSMLDIARAVSAFVVVAGVVVGMSIEPLIIGVSILLVGGAAFVWTHRRARARSELEIDELNIEADKALQGNLRALDDYCNLIASGDIPAQERLPDGTLKPLSDNTRPSFIADHGALLVLSREQSVWQYIPHRPIPMSPIWVKVGNRVASTRITARTILETSDNELFNLRTEWLLTAARQKSRQAESFRSDVCVLTDLRRLKAEGKTLDECKLLLSKEGYGPTRVAHMNAGIYAPFEKFLATLPLHDFP
jgi:hypothetical protein